MANASAIVDVILDIFSNNWVIFSIITLSTYPFFWLAGLRIHTFNSSFTCRCLYVANCWFNIDTVWLLNPNLVCLPPLLQHWYLAVVLWVISLSSALLKIWRSRIDRMIESHRRFSVTITLKSPFSQLCNRALPPCLVVQTVQVRYLGNYEDWDHRMSGIGHLCQRSCSLRGQWRWQRCTARRIHYFKTFVTFHSRTQNGSFPQNTWNLCIGTMAVIKSRSFSLTDLTCAVLQW